MADTTTGALPRPEPAWKVENCGSCFRPIIWAITTNAKPMPVDAEPPTTGGNVDLEYRGTTVQPLARVLGVAAQFGRTNLRTSHLATCPDSARWRARGRARRTTA
jgi:hypothetical protein